jgi:hypothetical protein
MKTEHDKKTAKGYITAEGGITAGRLLSVKDFTCVPADCYGVQCRRR